ncbi:hypothetical protein KFK09_019723 [Dendrobium nobile]|uniref:Uncharacterized protein n=1 Tax=Dendrobium nobile TaxID=94219 RepID=A0A8T3ARX4_DENNO|nr:hypothetical protein KFK09_019723 [Dendrobium nobile]
MEVGVLQLHILTKSLYILTKSVNTHLIKQHCKWFYLKFIKIHHKQCINHMREMKGDSEEKEEEKKEEKEKKGKKEEEKKKKKSKRRRMGWRKYTCCR